MVIRDAIVAHTDPELEADAAQAAVHLLRVLDDCERRDAHGKMQAHGNFAHLGLFMYYVWRRVARYGFDRAQQWTFYLFNGAMYENGAAH